MAAEDLTTLAAVKEADRISASASDALLGSLITRASHAITRWTGRQFAPFDAVATARVFELADDPGNPSALWIGELGAVPTAAVLTDPLGRSPGPVVVADHLLLLPRNRRFSWQPYERVRLRPSVLAWSAGYTLSITGRWGFPQIPPDVAEACIETVGEWNRESAAYSRNTPELQELGGVQAPRALPGKALHLLEPFRAPWKRKGALASVLIRGST